MKKFFRFAIVFFMLKFSSNALAISCEAIVNGDDSSKVVAQLFGSVDYLKEHHMRYDVLSQAKTPDDVMLAGAFLHPYWNWGWAVIPSDSSYQGMKRLKHEDMRVFASMEEFYKALEAYRAEEIEAAEKRLKERLLAAGDDVLKLTRYDDNYNRGRGDINVLQYAIRKQALEVASIIANSPNVFGTLTLKQAKPLLTEANMNDHPDGFRMTVFMAMTEDAYQQYQKSFGGRVRATWDFLRRGF